MGQVRNTIRAYAFEGHSPAAVLDATNQLLLSLRLNTIATCCYIQLDLDTAAATAVLAGHPPPILRTGKDADLLTLRRGAPLGASRRTAYAQTDFAFPTGATLLLYTDGLVEDRHHPIDQGFQELQAALAVAPSDDPEAILDNLLAGPVGPHPRSDDIALLCLVNTTGA